MGHAILLGFAILVALISHGLIALVVGGLAFTVVDQGPSLKTALSRTIFGLLFCGLAPQLTQFGLADLIQFPLLISLMAFGLYAFFLLDKSEKRDV